MKDGVLLLAVKRMTCLVVGGEIKLRRGLRRLCGRERYQLEGTCRRCAMCCETPAIQADLVTWYFPTSRRIFLWWQRYVNGLELIEQDRRTRSFVFRCSHFDRETRTCDSYESRPFMCRDYPRELLSDWWPDFFPQCGFRPIARDAARWRTVIGRADLPDNKKAELMRGLHLE